MTKNSVRVAFTVSILLNLLLVGITGGMMLHQKHKPWHEIKAEMSPETQHLMARTLQKSRRDMGGEMREMRAAKKALAKIMSAKEFDADAYERAMKRMSAARAKVEKGRTKAMKELATQLPREERKKLAGRFTRSPGRYPEKRKIEKDSNKIWPPPFRETVANEQKKAVSEPTLFVGPELIVEPPAPERKPVYGPLAEQPETDPLPEPAQKENPEEKFFSFDSIKVEPPPESPNN